MQYITRTVTAHAFTSTSSAYVVENTETVKVQSDVYWRISKDISIFFVIQHQLSIIIKHKQKKALLRNGKIDIQKHPLLRYNGSYKNYQNVLKGFIRRLRSYGVLFHDICWPVYFKFTRRGCDRKPP